MRTNYQLKRVPGFFNQGKASNICPYFPLRKKLILLSSIILMFLFTGTGGTWAQTNQNPAQTVCVGNEPYLITPTSGSTYSWGITPGTSGTEWEINGTENSIIVEWNVPGVYTLSVIERNAEGCYGQARSVVVTVNPTVTGTIAGTTTVCQNATAPLITFTGVNGTSPYTFTYNINGGENMSVTTTSGNSMTVSAPTGITGIFVYNLVSVRDASASACLQAQSGTATVTVSTSAIPTITTTVSPVCFGTTGVVYSTEQGMINYSWIVTGGLVTAGGTINDNTVTVTWNSSGPYSVRVNYNIATGCPQSSPATMDVTVIPLPVTSPIYHN
jgi:hypothetical protein